MSGQRSQIPPQKSSSTIKYHSICQPTLMNGINLHYPYNNLKKAHPYTKINYKTIRYFPTEKERDKDFSPHHLHLYVVVK